MQPDTRSKNQYFSHAKDYLGEYADDLRSAIHLIDRSQLNGAVWDIKKTVKTGGRVFVAGNGGSSSIAEHMTCDLEKGCHVKRDSIKTHSLCSNTALLTAIANDMGYEHVFRYQLNTQKLNRIDVVVLISSSGNSQNIVNAATYAKSVGAKVVGLTGFSGGQLLGLADHKLHIAKNNYGIVEDGHQAIMHVIAQRIYLNLCEEA